MRHAKEKVKRKLPAQYVSKKNFYKLRINCINIKKLQFSGILLNFGGTWSTMWLRISMHWFEKSANMCTDAVLIVY